MMKTQFPVLFIVLCMFLNSGAQTLSWAARIGGAGVDFGNLQTVDGSGNVITAGSFSGTVDFDPGPGSTNLSSNGGQDLFFIKQDAAGGFLWAVTFGGPNDEFDNAITCDGAGNLFLTGVFTGTVDFNPGPGVFNLTASGFDVFIVKLDPGGNFVWARKIGGSDDEVSYDIAADASGNTYTTGSFRSSGCDFDPGPGVFLLSPGGNYDEYVLKLDVNGNFVWAKRRVSASPGFTVAYSIDIDGSGNVYTTGAFSGTVDFDGGPGVTSLTSQDFMDAYLSKLDVNGNFVWSKQISGSTSIDFGRSVDVDAFNNIHIAGRFENTADFDPGPGVINLTAAGGVDGYIVKYNSSGNMVWVKTVGGAGSDIAFAVTADGSGNVYYTGSFEGTVDFDPGPGLFILNSPFAMGTYVCKLTNNGFFAEAKCLTGNTGIAGNGVQSDACGNVYITGSFSGTIDFEPGSNIFNLTADGTDTYILKFSQSYWTGAVSTNWHDPLNWECNTLPGVQGNAIIPTGAVRYPVVSSNAEVKSLSLQPGASVQFMPAVMFNANGKN